MNLIKCSFDFDETLDRKHIQEYAKELIDRKNIEVWVVTARYDNDTYAEAMFRRGRIESYDINADLFDVTNRLGIPSNRIIFTNNTNKYHYLKGKNFLWHLENDWDEIKGIIKNTNTIAVDSLAEDWKIKCENLLKNNSK